MDEVYNDLLQYEVALEEKNAALEESHQFIESVLASMSDILIVCDRNGSIEEVNSSLQRFSGKSAGQLERTPVFELFADDGERAKARELFSRQGRDGVHDAELYLRAGDGSSVPVSVNCTPRISQTGKLMGMVVTGRPVGELRRAYQALRQAHEDLKRTQSQLLHAEKMVSLGRLVAGVAHELNNPISFVLGNVLSLQRYAGRLESYLDAVHLSSAAADPDLTRLREELRIDRIVRDLSPLIGGMIEGAERTRDIVDALKRFSALDKSTPERVNLNEVVERSVRWVVQSAPASLVYVDTSVTERGEVRDQAAGVVELCGGPTAMRLFEDDANEYAAVTCPTPSELFIVDLSGFRVVANVPTGAGPYPIVFDRVRRLLYVGNTLDRTISVIDVAQDRPTRFAEIARVGLQTPYKR
jgi:two-component system sensor histidine kinase HupT/HoxJ